MLRLFISLFILSFVYIHSSKAEAFIELNDSNFDEEIRKYDIALVKFYAEWCGHCKKMAPEFAEAAEKLKNSDPPVQLVKVNCPNYQPLCEKYSVSGYPTLKIFRKGEFSEEYNGGRESGDIIKYMSARARPVSTLLSSEASIDKLREGTSSVFIAFVPSESDPSFEAFKEYANKHRDDYTFGHIVSSNTKAIRRYLPTAIWTKMEEPYAELGLPADKDKIESWIHENWGGLLNWMHDENPAVFDDSKNPWITIHFSINYERDPKGANYIRNRLIKAIKQLKEEGIKSKFAMWDAGRSSYYMDNNFGLKWDPGWKPVVTAKDKGKKYFMPYSEDFTYDTFKKFVKDFEAGKIAQHLKSEPVPESQPDAVVKVVAKNFDEVVRDTSKYALIEFFAPWCGHCKSLKPVYEELAQKLKGESDIVIAAMDATANDVPADFEVRGFPTLYWVDKNNKISKYEKGRGISDFTSFIEKEIGRELGSAKDEL